MFTIQGIDHIVLRTHCLDEMIQFYCDILGCKIERQQPSIGLTQIRAGSQLIDLLAVNEPIEKGRHNLEHFCLKIAPFDFEKLEKYFKSHQIKISRYGQRYGAQGLGFSFYLVDPQGNEIELQEVLA